MIQLTTIFRKSQYLIAEPSGNEADLTNPDNVNLNTN